MFVALLCGQVLKLISHKFSFPYTPLITILGIIFGYVAQYLGNLGEGIESWASIDPHVIMMVFLPALIFESAFNADWHTFKIELY
jgi:NhaP-type Na+/H+ or K+/H+ antiporter